MRLVLNLDRGLSAHLRAIAKGVGIYGSVAETAIYFIRTGVIENFGNENLRKMTLPHLPPDIRRACGGKDGPTVKRKKP